MHRAYTHTMHAHTHTHTNTLSMAGLLPEGKCRHQLPAGKSPRRVSPAPAPTFPHCETASLRTAGEGGGQIQGGREGYSSIPEDQSHLFGNKPCVPGLWQIWGSKAGMRPHALGNLQDSALRTWASEKDKWEAKSKPYY